MTVYHGTTDKYAKKIMVEGLLPRVHPFKIRRADRELTVRQREAHLPDVVYVSDNKTEAENFARFRANYERTALHQNVPNPDFHHTFIKVGGRQSKTAKPVVVVIDLPEDVMLEHDPMSSIYDPAYIHVGVIPAEYVKSVEPVSIESDMEETL